MDDLILLLKEVNRQLFQAWSYKKKKIIHSFAIKERGQKKSNWSKIKEAA